MAADVSSIVRVMNGGDATNESGKSTAPVTRDLLGGCESKELDLDLKVPCGWEKRLDLKSGKVYLQRFNSTNSSSSLTSDKNKNTTTESLTNNFQDLNFPPTPSKHTLNLFENPALDLKLLIPSPNNNACSSYQSVCTLDKVKSALERAEKETHPRVTKKRSGSTDSPRSSSSSSIKLDCDFDHEEPRSCGSFAAGCANCLLYVLISTSNPKCPRCNSNVPLPVGLKKPRIDLNISM